MVDLFGSSLVHDISGWQGRGKPPEIFWEAVLMVDLFGNLDRKEYARYFAWYSYSKSSKVQFVFL